ncbi:MAG: class I tRNA ligase family protein, partial [Acidimicrobiia bacterium]
PDLFARTFPMDLRPQAHEIIRTWLFSTAVRAHCEHRGLPWSDAAISGWILDPDRKKMSKSKGNVVTPMGLLERHGADAVRYWAAGGRPGADTVVDEGQMQVGRRLAIKLLNASRFVLNLAGGSVAGAPVTEPLDRSMLAGVGNVIGACTEAFEEYDYARALERGETAFWAWCDDYLELVKGRAYGEGEGAGSAHQALRESLSVFLRLFAPFLPYTSEEVWSWWREGSVHRAAWPTVEELDGSGGDPGVLEALSAVIAWVRKAKSDARASMRAPVARLVVTDTTERLDLIRPAFGDLREAANAVSVETLLGEALQVTVELAS